MTSAHRGAQAENIDARLHEQVCTPEGGRCRRCRTAGRGLRRASADRPHEYATGQRRAVVGRDIGRAGHDIVLRGPDDRGAAADRDPAAPAGTAPADLGTRRRAADSATGQDRRSRRGCVDASERGQGLLPHEFEGPPPQRGQHPRVRRSRCGRSCSKPRARSPRSPHAGSEKYPRGYFYRSAGRPAWWWSLPWWWVTLDVCVGQRG